MGVLKCYSPHCGLGWDKFHPAWLGQLPSSYRLRFLRVLELWEKEPSAENLWLVLSIFIPKDSGGVRPILLLSLSARLWSRLRHPLCSKWEQQMDQNLFHWR